MRINPLNNGGNVSFKSGYPTFGNAGHLNFKDSASVCENTNPFYTAVKVNQKKKGNVSFKGSPWSGRTSHDTVTFKGIPLFKGHGVDEKNCPPEGCQPIKPQTKVPQEGGILVCKDNNNHGHSLDIKG